MREKITAIIPTLNEDSNIEGALDALGFADEIIVIDSFSSDNTIILCEKRGVRIIQRVFDDFSSQKNYAIDQAKHEWIFVLDADERVSPSLSKEIWEAVETSQDIDAFHIFRTFYFKGTEIKFGGWQTDKVIRLFKKSNCRYDGKLVHEKVCADGPKGKMNHRLDHYSYQNKRQYEKKLSFYASLQAKELVQSKRIVNPLSILIKPVFRFIVLYVVRFGVLDGKPGFVLAKMHAHAVWQRYQNYYRLK